MWCIRFIGSKVRANASNRFCLPHWGRWRRKRRIGILPVRKIYEDFLLKLAMPYELCIAPPFLTSNFSFLTAFQSPLLYILQKGVKITTSNEKILLLVDSC